MTLVQIKDWLKTMEVAEHYYIGRLDNKQEMSLGVYDRPTGSHPVMALGGLRNSSYNVRGVSLLLHWTRNKNAAEAAAQALWDELVEIRDLDVGTQHIQYLQMTVPEPIGIGTDADGVYEYVINFNLYYRR